MSSVTSVAPGSDERVAEYLVVCGLPENGIHTPYQRRRADSTFDRLPISDVKFCASTKDLQHTPEFALISPQSINTGFLADDCYFVAARARHPDGPITAIEVLHDDDQVPPGFEVLPFVNKGRRRVLLAVERQRGRPAVLDVLVLRPEQGQKPPDGTYRVLSPTLNAGAFGEIVQLAYRTAAETSVRLRYEPQLLDRFPLSDHPDRPLPAEAVAQFCFPTGVALRLDMDLPSFFTFVLTDVKGTELYGSCLTFYEPQTLDASHFDMVAPVGAVVCAPKALCLLSRWPFYQTFRKFLFHLYRLQLSPSTIPLERFIGHFFSLSLPPSGVTLRYSLLPITTGEFEFTDPALAAIDSKSTRPRSVNLRSVPFVPSSGVNDALSNRTSAALSINYGSGKSRSSISAIASPASVNRTRHASMVRAMILPSNSSRSPSPDMSGKSGDIDAVPVYSLPAHLPSSSSSLLSNRTLPEKPTSLSCSSSVSSSSVDLLSANRHIAQHAWLDLLRMESESLQHRARRGADVIVRRLPAFKFAFQNELPLRTLFACLDLRSIVCLVSCLLAERKIVLLSASFSILHQAAEAVRSLLLPLQWKYTYVPVLPVTMSQILQSFQPFLVGVHGSMCDDTHFPRDVVLVDLDRRMITGCGLPWPDLPADMVFASWTGNYAPYTNSQSPLGNSVSSTNPNSNSLSPLCNTQFSYNSLPSFASAMLRLPTLPSSSSSSSVTTSSLLAYNPCFIENDDESPGLDEEFHGVQSTAAFVKTALSTLDREELTEFEKLAAADRAEAERLQIPSFALPTEWAVRLAHRLLPDAMAAFRPSDPAPAYCRPTGSSSDVDEADDDFFAEMNSGVAPFDQVIASMLDSEVQENSSTANSKSSSADSSGAAAASASSFVNAWASLFSLSNAAKSNRSIFHPMGAAMAGSDDDDFDSRRTQPAPAIVDAIQNALRSSGGDLPRKFAPNSSQSNFSMKSSFASNSFQFNDLRIRAALLELMVQILAPYRACIRPPPPNDVDRIFRSDASEWDSLHGGSGDNRSAQEVQDEISWHEMFDTGAFISAFHSNSSTNLFSRSKTVITPSKSTASAPPIVNEVLHFVRHISQTQAFQSFISFVWRPDQKAAPRISGQRFVSVPQEDPNISTLTLKNILFFDSVVSTLAPHIQMQMAKRRMFGEFNDPAHENVSDYSSASQDQPEFAFAEFIKKFQRNETVAPELAQSSNQYSRFSFATLFELASTMNLSSLDGPPSVASASALEPVKTLLGLCARLPTATKLLSPDAWQYVWQLVLPALGLEHRSFFLSLLMLADMQDATNTGIGEVDVEPPRPKSRSNLSDGRSIEMYSYNCFPDFVPELFWDESDFEAESQTYDPSTTLGSHRSSLRAPAARIYESKYENDESSSVAARDIVSSRRWTKASLFGASNTAESIFISGVQFPPSALTPTAAWSQPTPVQQSKLVTLNPPTIQTSMSFGESDVLQESLRSLETVLAVVLPSSTLDENSEVVSRHSRSSSVSPPDTAIARQTQWWNRHVVRSTHHLYFFFAFRQLLSANFSRAAGLAVKSLKSADYSDFSSFETKSIPGRFSSMISLVSERPSLSSMPGSNEFASVSDAFVDPAREFVWIISLIRSLLLQTFYPESSESTYPEFSQTSILSQSSALLDSLKTAFVDGNRSTSKSTAKSFSADGSSSFPPEPSLVADIVPHEVWTWLLSWLACFEQQMLHHRPHYDGMDGVHGPSTAQAPPPTPKSSKKDAHRKKSEKQSVDSDDGSDQSKYTGFYSLYARLQSLLNLPPLVAPVGGSSSSEPSTPPRSSNSSSLPSASSDISAMMNVSISELSACMLPAACQSAQHLSSVSSHLTVFQRRLALISVPLKRFLVCSEGSLSFSLVNSPVSDIFNSLSAVDWSILSALTQNSSGSASASSSSTELSSHDSENSPFTPALQSALLSLLSRFGLIDVGGCDESIRFQLQQQQYQQQISSPSKSSKSSSPVQSSTASAHKSSPLDGCYYSAAEVLGSSNWPSAVKQSVQSARVRLQGLNAPDSIAFSLPLSMNAQAICPSCQHHFSGEDVFAGWCDLHNTRSTSPSVMPSDSSFMQSPATPSSTSNSRFHQHRSMSQQLPPPKCPAIASACPLCGLETPVYIRVGFLSQPQRESKFGSKVGSAEFADSSVACMLPSDSMCDSLRSSEMNVEWELLPLLSPSELESCVRQLFSSSLSPFMISPLVLFESHPQTHHRRPPQTSKSTTSASAAASPSSSYPSWNSTLSDASINSAHPLEESGRASGLSWLHREPVIFFSLLYHWTIQRLPVDWVFGPIFRFLSLSQIGARAVSSILNPKPTDFGVEFDLKAFIPSFHGFQKSSHVASPTPFVSTTIASSSSAPSSTQLSSAISSSSQTLRDIFSDVLKIDDFSVAQEQATSSTTLGSALNAAVSQLNANARFCSSCVSSNSGDSDVDEFRSELTELLQWMCESEREPNSVISVPNFNDSNLHTINSQLESLLTVELMRSSSSRPFLLHLPALRAWQLNLRGLSMIGALSLRQWSLSTEWTPTMWNEVLLAHASKSSADISSSLQKLCQVPKGSIVDNHSLLKTIIESLKLMKTKLEDKVDPVERLNQIMTLRAESSSSSPSSAVPIPFYSRSELVIPGTDRIMAFANQSNSPEAVVRSRSNTKTDESPAPQNQQPPHQINLLHLDSQLFQIEPSDLPIIEKIREAIRNKKLSDALVLFMRTRTSKVLHAKHSSGVEQSDESIYRQSFFNLPLYPTIALMRESLQSNSSGVSFVGGANDMFAKQFTICIQQLDTAIRHRLTPADRAPSESNVRWTRFIMAQVVTPKGSDSLLRALTLHGDQLETSSASSPSSASISSPLSLAPCLQCIQLRQALLWACSSLHPPSASLPFISPRLIVKPCCKLQATKIREYLFVHSSFQKAAILVLTSPPHWFQYIIDRQALAANVHEGAFKNTTIPRLSNTFIASSARCSILMWLLGGEKQQNDVFCPTERARITVAGMLRELNESAIVIEKNSQEFAREAMKLMSNLQPKMQQSISFPLLGMGAKSALSMTKLMSASAKTIEESKVDLQLFKKSVAKPVNSDLPSSSVSSSPSLKMFASSSVVSSSSSFSSSAQSISIEISDISLDTHLATSHSRPPIHSRAASADTAASMSSLVVSPDCSDRSSTFNVPLMSGSYMQLSSSAQRISMHYSPQNVPASRSQLPVSSARLSVDSLVYALLFVESVHRRFVRAFSIFHQTCSVYHLEKSSTVVVESNSAMHNTFAFWRQQEATARAIWNEFFVTGSASLLPWPQAVLNAVQSSVFPASNFNSSAPIGSSDSNASTSDSHDLPVPHRCSVHSFDSAVECAHDWLRMFASRPFLMEMWRRRLAVHRECCAE